MNASLGHAAQRGHAVAVTAGVDSAEFAVESVGRKIFARRFRRGNEPLVRERKNLANSVIFQGNEITVLVREILFAIQATRISGWQPPGHGRQVAPLVRVIRRLAQVLFSCCLVRVLPHVVADVKTALEVLHHPERPAFRRYDSLNPPSAGPALRFRHARVTLQRFRDCLRVAGFLRACTGTAGTWLAGRPR